MSALIRSHKSVLGLKGHFGSTTSSSASISPANLYRNHSRTKTLLRSHRLKKCKIDDIRVRPTWRYPFETNGLLVHPSVASQIPLWLEPWSNSNLLRPHEQILTSNRHFSISSRLYDQPSSKVEVTVQTIKNKQKEKEEAAKKEALEPAGPSETKLVEQKPVVKKSLQQRIWDEVVHYYHGFRLLFIDINICRKLLWRVLMGKKLTRREHRLLIRTTSDLFRLVPFSIFIIVPFMELLLPVFIKFFPGMLPSTFQTAKEHEAKLKQSLQVKLEMAKFLQKTLDEMAVQHKDHKSEEAKDFSNFFKKIKNPDEHVTNDEIIKFSKQFEDEITLDSLSRDQLTALCRILEINTLGTNNFLRFQIRMKLRNLAADDRMIQKEGVESLTLYELQQACKTRGMRAYGLSEMRMRNQLQEWVDLNLNEKVPPSLLLLSRAMMVPDDTPTTDKLKATISALPDAVATQTKAAIGEREGKIDNKTKIEIIKEEERKIKEEREEEREEQRQVDKDKLREEAEILLDKAPVIEDAPGLRPARVEAVKVEEGISSKDVEVLGEALKNLSEDKKKLIVEKETIKDLKEEIEEYKEDVEELHEIRTSTGTKEEVRETRAAKILFKKVNSMINHLDTVLNTLEKKEKTLRQDIESVDEQAEVYAKKKDELVYVDELLDTIKQLQKVTDESRLSSIQKALSAIDADQDGQIKVDDVLKVIETIGKEDVKLSNKQLEELVAVLDKEEILEAEDKIEKALAKSLKESTQKTEEFLDVAPVIRDDAEDMEKSDEKHILSKQTTAKNDDIIKDKTILDAGAVAQAAADKQKEKILPTSSTTEIPSPLPPPPLPPSSKATNPKDKML